MGTRMGFKKLHAVGLKAKIVAATSFAIILTTVASSAFFYIRTKNIIFDNLQKRGMTICSNLSHIAKYGVLTEDTTALNELAQGAMQTEDVVYITIQNEQGKVLAEKSVVDMPDMTSLREKALACGKSEFIHVKNRAGSPIYNFSCPIVAKKISITEMGTVEPDTQENSSPQLRGTVQVGLLLSNALDKLTGVLEGVIILTLMIITGGVFASIGFVRIIMKPIEKMSNAAVRIASGDLSQQVNVESNDEIGQFAHQFNTMTLALKNREEQLNESYKEISFAKEQLEALNFELTQSAKNLERSNRELQDFAYIASHDLQEPLRKVQAFGDRLKTKYADTLGEAGLDYLERMQNAAARMKTLISDLLAYSRITTRPQPLEEFDLEQLTKEVLSDLEVRIDELHAHVEIGTLPIITADPLQMRQLIQNLIGNALKFHKPDEPPIIKIASRFVEEKFTDEEGNTSTSQLCQITVEDNGIGFEEKYASRIFGVFQRLHARGEYEGSGVGLAICRKIVERHGGTIIAKSQLGKGATFIVNLPADTVKSKNLSDSSMKEEITL